ncbi:MAG: oxidoreductase [Rhodothalassiaceae bacterium]|nr:MAG: oxidoreductase [Rhodothalassiaceae bacterium]
MAKAFASQADLEDKQVTFARLSDHAWAYTAEGDPNTGVIITDDGVMVIDTQATPAMARDVIARIREVTDAPIRYVVLSHYHAVRVLGASAYGAHDIIASRGTYELIVERGEADFKSEAGRFPRLFRGIDTIPGLTWPTIVFEEKLTVFMGGLEIQILHLGRGHTKGDTVVWLPAEGVLFSGDLVEFGATPYTGDAYLRDWPATLDRIAALQPKALVPGRGDALTRPEDIAKALSGTKAFITDLYESVAAGRAAGKSLKEIYRETYDRLAPKYGRWVIFDHCMPFDVARAYDEAGGKTDPEIWTAERDREMWAALEGET